MKFSAAASLRRRAANAGIEEQELCKKLWRGRGLRAMLGRLSFV
jgi:hypothetical protein